MSLGTPLLILKVCLEHETHHFGWEKRKVGNVEDHERDQREQHQNVHIREAFCIQKKRKQKQKHFAKQNVQKKLQLKLYLVKLCLELETHHCGWEKKGKKARSADEMAAANGLLQLGNAGAIPGAIPAGGRGKGKPKLPLVSGPFS